MRRADFRRVIALGCKVFVLRIILPVKPALSAGRLEKFLILRCARARTYCLHLCPPRYGLLVRQNVVDVSSSTDTQMLTSGRKNSLNSYISLSDSNVYDIFRSLMPKARVLVGRSFQETLHTPCFQQHDARLCPALR